MISDRFIALSILDFRSILVVWGFSDLITTTAGTGTCTESIMLIKATGELKCEDSAY